MSGATYERELRTLLTDLGYGAIRIGGSGAGGSQDLPDILAGEPQPGHEDAPNSPLCHSMAIELKSGSDTTLYCTKDEVAALRRFCEAFGAAPFLAARYTTQATPTDYYFVAPWNARMTDSGNFGLPVDDIKERASMVFHP